MIGSFQIYVRILLFIILLIVTVTGISMSIFKVFVDIPDNYLFAPNSDVTAGIHIR